MLYNEYKKTLSEKGYKISTKTFSFGKMVIYVHKITGQNRPDFLTPTTIANWMPFFEYIESLKKSDFEAMKAETGLIGLNPGKMHTFDLA